MRHLVGGLEGSGIVTMRSTIREGTDAWQRQHVVPRDGKWAVRRTGASRVSRKFDTQREAIEAARDMARRQGTDLYIYGQDGRIRERNSYGKDSFPPKG